MRNFYFTLSLLLIVSIGDSQTIAYNNQVFELKNVTASIDTIDGQKVLKVERDFKALPFDVKNLSHTVDEPTYIKLKNVDFENGVIEVKMLSRIQDPSPFDMAQGFIGVSFRISNNDTAFENIYLRPKVGRSDNQFFRNHTIQYYAYPNYKFDRLRKEANGMYETSAPINLNEWITMRIEVEGQKAYMYINNAKYSTFVVDKMKGSTTHGAIGLWVDIATIGYFKDLKVIKK